MSAFLYGIPGKLKTLIDRLTSARAAKLDNLDTTVGSRAPASTALSNAVWTDDLAGNIADGVREWDPILQPPIGLVPASPGQSTNVTTLQLGNISGLEKTDTSSTSFEDIVNYAGGGVLEFCALAIYQELCYLKLIVDGTTLADISLDPSSSNWAAKAVAGLYLNTSSYTTIALSQIPFRESLVIQARVSSSGTASVYYKYRKAYD